MRRRKPAPHGFAVNGNLNKIKRLNLTCRICCSPPGNLGNHAGRLAVDKPFTGSPKVLLITTQGRPAHLTCGQTIVRIIIPRPRSWRKGQLLPLSGQNASLETNKTSRHPFSGRQPACGSSWRFFLCRSLRRERTRMADIHFSSYKANVSFPRSPHSPGKRPESFMLQKIFSIFF